MWLIPMMILLVSVGVVLIIIGKETLESGRVTWPGAISGTLCLFAGMGILVQTFITLLEI